MIDRRGLKRQKLEAIDERVADRYKFDGDSSEDEEIYPADWTDTLHIRYRIMIERQGEKQQAQIAAQNRRAIQQSASGHLMPPSNTASA